jgi:hypothetical protein
MIVERCKESQAALSLLCSEIRWLKLRTAQSVKRMRVTHRSFKVQGQQVMVQTVCMQETTSCDALVLLQVMTQSAYTAKTNSL